MLGLHLPIKTGMADYIWALPVKFGVPYTTKLWQYGTTSYPHLIIKKCMTGEEGIAGP